MSYELKMLEELVTQKPTIAYNEDEQTLKQTLKLETDRIQEAFINKVFHTESDRIVQNYIEVHQTCLIDLIDSILGNLSKNDVENIFNYSPKKESNDPLIQVYKACESLLSFIEKHFSNHFNLDAKVPESYLITADQKIRKQLPSLESRLKGLSIEPDIISTILRPFHLFINRHYKRDISYNLLVYLKDLLTELLSWVDSNMVHEDLFSSLMNTLVYINLNSSQAFGVLTRLMKDDYQQFDNLDQQLLKLSWFGKTINQCQEKPNLAYEPHKLSLKNILSEWVDDEYRYLSRHHQISMNFQEEIPTYTQDHFKINTSLPVEQLGYFIKLLLDSGIIQNKNQTKVIEFFARHFRTKRAESISAQSLWNKSYSPVSKSMIKLKDKLREMIEM